MGRKQTIQFMVHDVSKDHVAFSFKSSPRRNSLELEDEGTMHNSRSH
jgi:hypothetical protein